MAEIPPIPATTRTQKYQSQVNYFDRWQRIFLLVGAFYDGIFGVLVYFAPKATVEFFRLVVPEGGRVDLVWLQLVGIFLIILSLLYLLAARNPSRYLGIVLVCVVGKIWSVGFYCYYCFVLGAPLGFMFYAVLDLAFFFLHIWAMGPDRKRRAADALAIANLRG